MRQTTLTTALLLTAAAAMTYVVWLWIGMVGVVVCAPLFGIVLAKPLLDALSACKALFRERTYRNISGRHYAHRGNLMDIQEDLAHDRWLRVADVRKVIRGLPNDPVLRRLYPADVQLWESPPVLRIRVETLLVYLEKITSAESLRFRLWLEREVAMPARNRRKRG